MLKNLLVAELEVLCKVDREATMRRGAERSAVLYMVGECKLKTVMGENKGKVCCGHLELMELFCKHHELFSGDFGIAPWHVIWRCHGFFFRDYSQLSFLILLRLFKLFILSQLQL